MRYTSIERKGVEWQVAERGLEGLLLGAVAFTVSRFIPEVGRIRKDFGERLAPIYKLPNIMLLRKQQLTSMLLHYKQYSKAKLFVLNEEREDREDG